MSVLGTITHSLCICHLAITLFCIVEKGQNISITLKHRKNGKYFHYQASRSCSIDIIMWSRGTFFFELEHLRAQRYCSLSMKKTERLAHDACVTSTTHVDLFMTSLIQTAKHKKAALTAVFFFFFLTTVLSHWDFSHGKFELLSPRKASCYLVALPSLRGILGDSVFP